MPTAMIVEPTMVSLMFLPQLLLSTYYIGFSSRVWFIVKRIRLRYQDMKMYFLLIYFLLGSSDIEAKAESHECTFSFIPFLTKVFPCRTDAEQSLESLRVYWKSEDDGTLCHYFYLLADPSASKKLLLDNYKIMATEIEKRGIDCIKDHRGMYFGTGEKIQKHVGKILKWDESKLSR